MKRPETKHENWRWRFAAAAEPVPGTTVTGEYTLLDQIGLAEVQVELDLEAPAPRRARAADLAALLPEQVHAGIAEFQSTPICRTGHPADDILFDLLNSIPLDVWEMPEDLEAMEGHVPVMLEECLDALAAVADKRYLDGTFGGGGHTRALLELGAEVVAFDRDPAARERAEDRLADHLDALTVVHGNFADALELLGPDAIGSFDGILLDLGISSIQLDDPERGFSFQTEGPLDMRMDTSRGQTAADLVNTLEPRELARIFKVYGEEPQANRVASAIARARVQAPIDTTKRLAEVVAQVLPRTGKRHPATRVFQALRIAVNDELESLRRALPMLTKLLKPGGRLAIISFHSLEDRIVKHFLQETSREWLDRPEWPGPRPNPEFAYRLVGRKPVIPTEEEIERNPRSRSAKLRVAERVYRPEI